MSALFGGEGGSNRVRELMALYRDAHAPEQLLDVTIARRIVQIPGDRLQDRRRLEVLAFKSSLDRRFSRSAIAFRIMGRLRTRGDKVDRHA